MVTGFHVRYISVLFAVICTSVVDIQRISGLQANSSYQMLLCT